MKKNEEYPYIPFRDTDDQIILKTNWMRAFWSISCKAEFSQIRSLQGGKGKAFHFSLLPEKKVMAKAYEKSTKLHFGPILDLFFSNFG